MNNKSKQYQNPKFGSIEEEDKYWETHSPLAEGLEGEVQTTEQKRSSFLSVRMTGDELSQLRDEAAKLGLGPSTYARLVLTHVITGQNESAQYTFGYVDSNNWKHESNIGPRGIYIMNIDDININQDIANSMFRMICNTWKCRVVTPDDAAYEIVKPLVQTLPQP